MPPVTTDESLDKSSSVPKERRFKLSRACDRCRRRRIKCDEGHPCQSCLSANSACTFEESGKRSHPHKSKRAATLEDRMHHLESLIQAISPAAFATSSFSSASGSSSATPDCTNPYASLASSTHAYPMGVPPPSLNVFPLMNPSTHFTHHSPLSRNPGSGSSSSIFSSHTPQHSMEQLTEETCRMSLSPSYLYLDDEGYTRWQGETSGLPLLDLLVEREGPQVIKHDHDSSTQEPWRKSAHISTGDWFPDRIPRRPAEVNPQTLWKLITSFIAPDLMDSLVQCYLSTSYYLLPFLHVPTFLADYGNPQKWGEPGFAAFIVAICCLSSRHTDDPRVKADPTDGFSAGVQWFELFARLRTIPTADRPTLYTVQSVFVAGVYAVGLGKLSRAFALISEAITLSIDGGLHRSAEAYDCFDPIEQEVRKRTFWCVYMWDKQAAAAFGRPPMIRLRDCDVPEPAVVDDEFITQDGVGNQPVGVESRMSAFVATVRLFVVLESVLDVPPTLNYSTSPFLGRAATILSGFMRHKALREEEALLDELRMTLSPHWTHSAETMASDDVIRVTQAERLHCLEQFIRMLIQRHRFSDLVAERTYGGGEGEQTAAEREAMMASHECSLQIVAAHLHIATKGLMTYYGVHVIHQLTQAGRTLIAVLLNCNTEDLRPLIPPSLDALRSCVGLLRRFSGRYLCGLRSGDLIEEFCRLTQIPLDAPARQEGNKMRPPWIRPVRKKTPSVARSAAGSNESQRNSPEHHSPSSALSDHDTFDFIGSSGGGGGGGRGGSPPFTGPGSSSNVNGGDGPGGSARGLTPPAQGFMDQSSITYMDSSLSIDMMRADGPISNGGMLPPDLMALFDDSNFDMSSMFAAGAGGAGSSDHASPGGGMYGAQYGGPSDGVGLKGLVSSP